VPEREEGTFAGRSLVATSDLKQPNDLAVAGCVVSLRTEVLEILERPGSLVA
jgi:hypothetical protein